MSGPTLEVVSGRVRLAGDDTDIFALKGRNDAGQVVVKRVGAAKSRHATRNMAIYIARWRPMDDEARQMGEAEAEDVALYDGTGRALVKEDLGAVLDEWDILPQAKNRARLSRSATDAELARLPEQHRLHLREVEHFVVSVKREDMPKGVSARELLEATTRGIVDEMFIDHGYDALWAVHTEHLKEARNAMEGVETKHPHAHILVRAKSASGSRLRFTPDKLDEFRAVAVRRARGFGINVTASRRVDRREVREAILSGKEPLKTGKRLITARSADKGRLAERAPEWVKRHGGDWLRRREHLTALWARARAETSTGLGAKRRVDAQLPVPNDREGSDLADAPLPFKRLREAMQPAYQNPDAAFRRFIELAASGAEKTAEGKMTLPTLALARWYLLRQPLAFGMVTAKARQMHRNPLLLNGLDQMKELGEGIVEMADKSREGVIAPEQGTDARLDERDADQAILEEMADILRRLARQADDMIFRRGLRKGEDLGYETAADRVRAIADELAVMPIGTEQAPQRQTQDQSPALDVNTRTQEKQRERHSRQKSRGPVEGR